MLSLSLPPSLPLSLSLSPSLSLIHTLESLPYICSLIPMYTYTQACGSTPGLEGVADYAPYVRYYFSHTMLSATARSCGHPAGTVKLTPAAINTCEGAVHWIQSFGFECPPVLGTEEEYSPDSCGAQTGCDEFIAAMDDARAAQTRAGLTECAGPSVSESSPFRGYAAYAQFDQHGYLSMIATACGLPAETVKVSPSSSPGGTTRDKRTFDARPLAPSVIKRQTGDLARIKPLSAALSVARAAGASAERTQHAGIKLLARLRSAAALASEARERTFKYQIVSKRMNQRTAAPSTQSVPSSSTRAMKQRKHAAALEQGGGGALASLFRAYKERKVTRTASRNATPKTVSKARQVLSAASRARVAAAGMSSPLSRKSSHMPRSWLRRTARGWARQRGARPRGTKAAAAMARPHSGRSLWQRLQGKMSSEWKTMARWAGSASKQRWKWAGAASNKNKASDKANQKLNTLSMRRTKPKSRKARRAQSRLRHLLRKSSRGKGPGAPTKSTKQTPAKTSTKQTPTKPSTKQTPTKPSTKQTPTKPSTKQAPTKPSSNKASGAKKESQKQKQTQTWPPSVEQNARKQSASKVLGKAPWPRTQATRAGPPGMRQSNTPGQQGAPSAPTPGKRPRRTGQAKI